MKIEIKRKLENKVFTTSFKRVVAHDDADAEKEKALENDFGPVVLATGGIVEKAVKVESGSVVLDETEGAAKNLRFNVKGIVLPLIDGAEFAYHCDAKTETAITGLTALQTAEAKCKAYEAFVGEKVKEAVEAWRIQKTGFESEVVPAIEEDLTPAPTV